MYECIRGEPIILIYDINPESSTLTGNEMAFCHLKDADKDGKLIKNSPVRLNLKKYYNPAVGEELANLTFSGSSFNLEAGNYVFEAWIEIGNALIPLGGTSIKLIQNVADLPT